MFSKGGSGMKPSILNDPEVPSIDKVYLGETEIALFALG